MTREERLKKLTKWENFSAIVSEFQAEEYILCLMSRSDRTTKKEFDQMKALLETIGYTAYDYKNKDQCLVWGKTV